MSKSRFVNFTSILESFYSFCEFGVKKGISQVFNTPIRKPGYVKLSPHLMVIFASIPESFYSLGEFGVKKGISKFLNRFIRKPSYVKQSPHLVVIFLSFIWYLVDFLRSIYHRGSPNDHFNRESVIKLKRCSCSTKETKSGIIQRGLGAQVTRSIILCFFFFFMCFKWCV